MYLEKIALSLILSILLISCSETKNTVVTANLIEGEWTDGTGYSMYVKTNDTIEAFGIKIPYRKLNDSSFEISYPTKPLEINAEINSYFDTSGLVDSSRRLHEWATFKNTIGSTNSCSSKREEIYFGADALKYEIIKKGRINIYFPKKSVWRVRSVGDSIKIFNENRSMFYMPFID